MSKQGKQISLTVNGPEKNIYTQRNYMSHLEETSTGILFDKDATQN